MVYSLSYHFLKSNRDKVVAFKYTVKAASQSMSNGAYSEGLVYAKAANRIIAEYTEVRQLKHVVNRGLSGFVHQRKSHANRSIVQRLSSLFHQPLTHVSEEEQGYIDLIGELEKKAIELGSATDLRSKDPDNFLGQLPALMEENESYSDNSDPPGGGGSVLDTAKTMQSNLYELSVTAPVVRSNSLDKVTGKSKMSSCTIQ